MISILMTVGDLETEQRGPVLAALRETLENRAVEGVHVLSDGNPVWLSEEMGALADRLHIEWVAERATFAMLFGAANRLLDQGAGCVAIMKADVSIPVVEDVARLQAALDSLADLATPVVLALARHERRDGRPGMALYDETGMPDFTSADAWIFRRPVHPTRALSYRPGQTRSDMLLARDLMLSGCALFNPCLDVTLLHHGTNGTDQDDGQHAAAQQAAQAETAPTDPVRIPWVRSTWLRAGYRPQPLHTHGPALILMSDDSDAPCSDAAIARLSEIGAREGRDCQIVHHGNLDAFFERHAEALIAAPNVAICSAGRPHLDLRRALLEGQQDRFDRIAFVHDLSWVTPEVLAEATAIVIASGKTTGTVADPLGCTLVTSVFRSDDFLQGFINNSAALQGYHDLIDHIFLVARMSDLEIRLLNGMLRDHPNVMVFWNRKDPGLYNCWNLGIRMARRRYVSNANVDDLRDPAHVVTLVADLEQHPEVVVASTALNPFYVFPADGTLPEERAGWYSDQSGHYTAFDLAHLPDDGTAKLIPHNMPHCMPVWRRALHRSIGWFNEDHYGTYADWAFWMKALQGGRYGWMNPAPLSFYFVNPTSHNRRGTDLERRHALIEDEFLPMLLAHRDGRFPFAGQAVPDVPAKLMLGGRDQVFGQHRNSFNRLIHALAPLERTDGEGVIFVPFLERQFVWGDAPGEAGSDSPAPITRPWIGILHVPFDAPDWFEPAISPENFFATDLWQESRPHCRGIITLSADLEADLNAWDPDLPTLAVRHPVELDVPMFDLAAYRARPRVVQVGDWLRKLQAIHRLKLPTHERIMLLKLNTHVYLDKDIQLFGDHRDPAVAMRTMVPNHEYDRLLSSSVVLCLMYNTAANNVVIECIARATPMLVNPLPAVVEYLGRDYPLYARDEEEAALLLSLPDRVEAAHLYLLKRRHEIDLSYEGFCRDIAQSDFYNAL